MKIPDRIGERFLFEGEIKEIRPLGEGLINDTFFVETIGGAPNYILQRKNGNIFKYIPEMMENIRKVILHLKNKIGEYGGDPLRETLTLIPSVTGNAYYVDEGGEYWVATLFIADTITYDKADSPELAYQGGKGIGRFQAMLSDFGEPLSDTLPGFHNMRFRFEQWDAIVKRDPLGRAAEVAEEVGWIESRREEMLAFWSRVESGEIPVRVTHNDTKISNILFDNNRQALCVIDLDTVLSSTCLNDFGDAIRSYANTGLEDDRELGRVSLNMDIFESYAAGYLSEARVFLLASEVENLAFSAKYITFEQTLRFLMDYIDGDNYYKIKYPEHNLVRARAQYKLLTSMEENYSGMREVIGRLI